MLILLRSPSRLLSSFRFSSTKPPTPPPPPNKPSPRQQPSSSIAKKIQNKLHEFNQKSFAQSQLIRKPLTSDKSTRQLRDLILYEDILRTQKLILLYDTNGIQHKQLIYHFLFLFAFTFLTSYMLHTIKQKNLRLKVELEYTMEGKMLTITLKAFAFFLFATLLVKYRKIQRSTVEKIVFNTETSEFVFTRRSWWGGKYEQRIPKEKLMYTENQKLWNKGVNYYHLDTLERYSISLEKGWVKGKEGLFSHLIAQRIRLKMKRDGEGGL